MAENCAQIVEIARIAHRDQDVPGPHAHGAAAQFLIAVDPELVELLGLAMALAGDMVLGEGEDREKHRAEDDAGDGGFGLGETG